MAKVPSSKRKSVRHRAKRGVARAKVGFAAKKTVKARAKVRPRISASDATLHQSIAQRISEFCKYLEYRRNREREIGKIKKDGKYVDPIRFINDCMEPVFPVIGSKRYKEFLEYRSKKINLWNAFLSRNRVRNRAKKIKDDLHDIEYYRGGVGKISKKHARGVVSMVVAEVAGKFVSVQESTNIKRIVLAVIIAVLRDDNFHEILRKYKSNNKMNKVDELVHSLINELLDFNRI